jgi:hypothetical protein
MRNAAKHHIVSFGGRSGEDDISKINADKPRDGFTGFIYCRDRFLPKRVERAGIPKFSCEK